MATGLDQFLQVVKDFRSVAGLATKAAVGIPLAGLFVDLGPSWPGGVGVITPVLELLVILLIFEFWSDSSPKWHRIRIAAFASLIGVACITYLWVKSSYTTPHPHGGVVAHGYTVRPEVRSILDDDYTVTQALEGAGYDPMRIWTPQSVTAIRVLLLASWLTAFASLAAVIAVFVMHQGSRQIPSPRSRRRTAAAVAAAESS